MGRGVGEEAWDACLHEEEGKRKTSLLRNNMLKSALRVFGSVCAGTGHDNNGLGMGGQVGALQSLAHARERVVNASFKGLLTVFAWEDSSVWWSPHHQPSSSSSSMFCPRSYVVRIVVNSQHDGPLRKCRIVLCLSISPTTPFLPGRPSPVSRPVPLRAAILAS